MTQESNAPKYNSSRINPNENIQNRKDLKNPLVNLKKIFASKLLFFPLDSKTLAFLNIITVNLFSIIELTSMSTVTRF
jgi:hypothetical protein